MKPVRRTSCVVIAVVRPPSDHPASWSNVAFRNWLTAIEEFPQTLLPKLQLLSSSVVLQGEFGSEFTPEEMAFFNCLRSRMNLIARLQ